MKLPIQVGQTLQMLLPVKERTVQCFATVLDVGQRTFDTSLPQRHGVRIPVEVDQITLSLTMPDAVYTLTCPVLVRNEEGLSLGIPPGDEIKRVQRRQFVRVPTCLPCAVEVELADQEGVFGPPHLGELQDISGGGCSMVIEPELDRGTLVRVMFNLPEEGELLLFGRVMRTSPVQTRKGPRWSVGVDFGKMDEGLRSMIIRHVFAIQREMARKDRMPKGLRP